MSGYVLTYHSHHVVGKDYARNDHIALPADLELITDAGCKIVSLDTLVDAFFDAAAAGGGSDEGKLVAITFDEAQSTTSTISFTRNSAISAASSASCVSSYRGAARRRSRV